MGLFSLFWLAMMGVIASSVFMSDAPLFAILFTLLPLSFGAVPSYRGLAGLLNTTRIEVSRSGLTLHHGPLPWPGNRTLPGQDLTQLYCQEERVQKLGPFQTAHPLDGRSSTYRLLAIDRQGRKVELLAGLTDKDLALYLELALERQLGIEDSPVAGELAERTGRV